MRVGFSPAGISCVTWNALVSTSATLPGSGIVTYRRLWSSLSTQSAPGRLRLICANRLVMPVMPMAGSITEIDASRFITSRKCEFRSIMGLTPTMPCR